MEAELWQSGRRKSYYLENYGDAFLLPLLFIELVSSYLLNDSVV